MPYALQPPLADGQKNPGGMYVRDRSEVPDGWGFVPQDSWPSDWRYDATSRAVRPPTAAEALADAKIAKKAEAATRMHRDNRALYPEVSEVEGAWVAEALLDTITDPRGMRVASIKANRDKRTRFYVLVDAAVSVDAVRLLTWEGA